jgi:hypothetical protein
MELEIVKWFVFAGLGLAIYFLKRTIELNDSKIKDLETKLLAVTLEQQTIKQEYLHKSDFKEFKTELRGWFDEMKLDIRSLRDHKDV